MKKYYLALSVTLFVLFFAVLICPQGHCAQRERIREESKMITDKDQIRSVVYSHSHMSYHECFWFEIFIRDGAEKPLYSANCVDPKGSVNDRIIFERAEIDGSALEHIRAIVIKQKLTALRSEPMKAPGAQSPSQMNVPDETSMTFIITFDDESVINQDNESPGIGEAMREIKSCLVELASRTAKKVP